MALIHGRNIVTVAVAQGAGAATTDLVAAPTGTDRIVVVALSLALGATAGTIQFQSGTGPTNITGAQAFAINGGMTMVGNIHVPVLFAGQGEKLTIVTTGSGANGWLNYYIATQ